MTWQPLANPARTLAPVPSPRIVPHTWQRGELLAETAWAKTHRAWPAGEDDAPHLIAKVARCDSPSPRQRDLAHSLIVREAAVAASVRHPHLTTTLFAELGEGDAWLIQPDPGEGILQSLDRVSIVRKLWSIRQAASALAALHSNGWLHGNVSPAALSVSSQGHITLGELGWSRKVGSEECALQHTDFTGTLRYAAPEAFDSSGQLTPTADIYSLGAVLYEVLAGEPFLSQYSGRELVAAKRMLSAQELVLPFDVPYRVSSLLARMLAREPLRRPVAAEVVEGFVAAEVECFASWENESSDGDVGS